MPYTARAKMIDFMVNEEKFPCHFDYKIGDGFTYDGEKFEGRVCPGLIRSVVADMLILEKIKVEPGLTLDDILKRYNDFERYEVYPQLNPDLVRLMLEEIETVNYIELRQGRAYHKK